MGQSKLSAVFMIALIFMGAMYLLSHSDWMGTDGSPPSSTGAPAKTTSNGNEKKEDATSPDTGLNLNPAKRQLGGNGVHEIDLGIDKNAFKRRTSEESQRVATEWQGVLNRHNGVNPMVLGTDWHRGWIDSADPNLIQGWYCHRAFESKSIVFVLAVWSPHQDEGNATKVRFRMSQAREDVVAASPDQCGHAGQHGFKVVPPPGTKGGDQYSITVFQISHMPQNFAFPNYGPSAGQIARAGFSASAWPENNHRRGLPIVVDNTQPVRLNVLVPGLGTDLTGGPLSILHFCVLSAKAGIRVRWINIDGHGVNFTQLSDHLQKYKGLGVFRDLVEFVHDGFNDQGRRHPKGRIRVNEKDQYMATVYFTAFYAWHTVREVGYRSNIIYFIQDFEPIFFAQDSNWLEAFETYTIPHFPIFSTPFLEKYFRANKHGLYSHCMGAECDDWGYNAEPSVKRHAELDARNFPLHRKKKMVVYARPHAQRNAYDATVSVISKAVADGVFGNYLNWEFIGLGSVYGEDPCNLGGYPDVCLTLVRNIPEPHYLKLLSRADIGFSLMASPHPSLPPFDFAAAGLITLTNAFETKDVNSFSNISKNVIVKPPFLQDLVDGMREAVARIDKLEDRRKDSELNWARSWDDDRCYGPTLMKKLKSWIATAELKSHPRNGEKLAVRVDTPPQTKK